MTHTAAACSGVNREGFIECHSPKQLCPRRVPRDQTQRGHRAYGVRPARDSKQANLLRQSLETIGTPIDEVEDWSQRQGRERFCE